MKAGLVQLHSQLAFLACMWWYWWGGRGGGGHRVGLGTRCREICPERKWPDTDGGKKKKKRQSFQWGMTGPYVGTSEGLRSWSDKDATDRLTADDRFKQAQEFKWRRALSLPLTKPNWIGLMVSESCPRGAAAAQQTQTLLPAGERRLSLCPNRQRRHLQKLSRANWNMNVCLRQ